MKLEKPVIEYVELDPADMIVASGCPPTISWSSSTITSCVGYSAVANWWEIDVCGEGVEHYHEYQADPDAIGRR